MADRSNGISTLKGRGMSALGQKQTFAVGVSAFGAHVWSRAMAALKITYKDPARARTPQSKLSRLQRASKHSDLLVRF
jgi:hypothetical protein